MAYALAMVVVPIVVMTLFRDRKDRYLLPMLAPACVLAGQAVVLVFRDRRRRPVGAAVVFSLHFLILTVLTVGVPVAAVLLPRDEYEPASGAWLSPTVGLPLAVGGVAMVVIAVLLFRRFSAAGLLAGTVACVMFTAHAFLLGYGGAREARADLKPIAEAVRREVPTAAVWHAPDSPPPPGWLIYAGRVVREFDGEFVAHRPNVLIVRQRKREPDPAPPTGLRRPDDGPAGRQRLVGVRPLRPRFSLIPEAAG